MNLHKSHFNNMFKRTEEGLVEDFIDYMNQPWCEIIFHPEFKKFREVIFKMIKNYGTEIGTLKNLEIEKWPYDLLETIEDSTIDFIKRNREHFFNFLIPS